MIERLIGNNKQLHSLILVNGVFVLAASMFPPLFAIFVKDIGGDIFSAGTVLAIFSIITGVLTYLFSFYWNKIKNYEHLIAAGYFLRILAWIGYYFSSALWQIYFLQVILAVGESLGSPAFGAAFSRRLSENNYVKEWGLWGSFASIASGLAAFLGGAIVLKFGFQALFLLMVLLAIFSLVLFLHQLRETLPSPIEKFRKVLTKVYKFCNIKTSQQDE